MVLAVAVSCTRSAKTKAIINPYSVSTSSQLDDSTPVSPIVDQLGVDELLSTEFQLGIDVPLFTTPHVGVDEVLFIVAQLAVSESSKGTQFVIFSLPKMPVRTSPIIAFVLSTCKLFTLKAVLREVRAKELTGLSTPIDVVVLTPVNATVLLEEGVSLPTNVVDVTPFKRTK